MDEPFSSIFKGIIDHSDPAKFKASCGEGLSSIRAMMANSSLFFPFLPFLSIPNFIATFLAILWKGESYYPMNLFNPISFVITMDIGY